MSDAPHAARSPAPQFAHSSSTPPPSGWLARSVPALGWLRSYDRAWLRPDIVAGITLAAYVLPAALGYATLANLPAQAGLYACLFGGLVFWLFCSSRHTAITVTSAISLLVGSSLGELAGGDTTRFAALAACTALMVAAIAFIAWLVRAGVIVNFVSETVMVGFKTGVACVLTSTQLPKFFGFKGTHGNFWENMRHFFSHLHETNAASLTFGLAALAVLILGKFLLKNKPVSLFVVIGGILVASMADFEARGVKMLGEVPQGLPALGVPEPGVHWADINTLLPLAFACFMLAAVETAAIGRTFVAKHGGRFDPNQEFLALAAANLASGVGHGFPVSGGMTQSLVNESGGARTPLSSFTAAVILLLVTLFLSGLLQNLPQPVLAAIVLVAVSGLFKFKTIVRLWRLHRGDFVVAMAALLGVLGSGLLRGVMIGAILSLVLMLRQASRPHVAVLGRIPGTKKYSDLERSPDNEEGRGVVIVRPEASLVYFNVEHVCEQVLRRARTPPPQATPTKLVILDLSASPRLDLQAADALASLASELKAAGIALQVVEARSSVRDMLQAEGLDEKLGGVNRASSVADAVESFEATRTRGT